MCIECRVVWWWNGNVLVPPYLYSQTKRLPVKLVFPIPDAGRRLTTTISEVVASDDTKARTCCNVCSLSRTTYRPLTMRSVGSLIALSFLRSGVTAFAPTAAPRFDVFAGSILGKWQNGEETSEVTEVMRSCGGAVQGVREVPVSNQEESIYLNRANDGWVYWEDASYSLGPVKLTEDNHNKLCTSLSLGKRFRVLISTQLAVSSSNVEIRVPEQQTITLGRPDSADSVSVSMEADGGLLPPGWIEWSSQLRCRMSSTSQPWILQRVKWESQGDSRSEEAEMGESSSESSRTIKPWIHVEHRDNQERCITVGACFVDSGDAVAICREYQANGNLSSISYLQGKANDAGEEQEQ
jgi:hypothetical protein